MFVAVKRYDTAPWDIFAAKIDPALSPNVQRCFDYVAKVRRLYEKLGISSGLWTMPIDYPEPPPHGTMYEYRFRIPADCVAGYVCERTWEVYVSNPSALDSFHDFTRTQGGRWDVSVLQSFASGEISVILKSPVEREHLQEYRKWQMRDRNWRYVVIDPLQVT